MAGLPKTTEEIRRRFGHCLIRPGDPDHEETAGD